MRKYRITISVKEYQTYEVEAESKEQAIEMWENGDNGDNGIFSSDRDVIAYNYEDDGEYFEITDEGEVKE